MTSNLAKLGMQVYVEVLKATAACAKQRRGPQFVLEECSNVHRQLFKMLLIICSFKSCYSALMAAVATQVQALCSLLTACATGVCGGDNRQMHCLSR